MFIKIYLPILTISNLSIHHFVYLTVKWRFPNWQLMLNIWSNEAQTVHKQLIITTAHVVRMLALSLCKDLYIFNWVLDLPVTLPQCFQIPHNDWDHVLHWTHFAIFHECTQNSMVESHLFGSKLAFPKWTTNTTG